MSDPLLPGAEDFLQQLEQILRQHPGISEYDLIQQLKQAGYFNQLSVPALPHELFRVHFFLFHSLYLLRDRLLAAKQGILEIHTLEIRLLPYQSGSAALQQQDALRAYYLDLENMDSTSEDDVYQLLTDFWNNLDRTSHRKQALEALGLEDPVDDTIIKKEYRRLAMLHHPDRGGDNDKLQQINQAVELLLGKKCR